MYNEHFVQFTMYTEKMSYNWYIVFRAAVSYQEIVAIIHMYMWKWN